MPAIRTSILVAAALATSCVRDPAEHVCPAELAQGGLVVTELRGAQAASAPDQSQWIELYNASGAATDLVGLHVRIRRPDGSGEDRIIVRDNLPVAADAYVVIGVGFSQPAHVDYAAGGDTGTNLLANAAIQLELCEGFADELRYIGLPSPGTYSLGLAPPTAYNMPQSWCTDPTPAGTPGAANPPCP